MYERFIEVFDFDQKRGKAIAEHIKVALKNFTLDIDLCRGQSFDNASNMSGKFKGVKTRILKEIPQAYFSSCSAHTLNLCGVHAMETSVEVKTFFGTVMSKNCINCLHRVHQGGQQNTANISLHSISTTRWSARIDAIRPLVMRCSNILEALENIDE